MSESSSVETESVISIFNFTGENVKVVNYNGTVKSGKVVARKIRPTKEGAFNIKISLVDGVPVYPMLAFITKSGRATYVISSPWPMSISLGVATDSGVVLVNADGVPVSVVEDGANIVVPLNPYSDDTLARIGMFKKIYDHFMMNFTTIWVVILMIVIVIAVIVGYTLYRRRQ